MAKRTTVASSSPKESLLTTAAAIPEKMDKAERPAAVVIEGEPKTLSNVSIANVKENVSDVIVVGNGDMFQLLCKASSVKQGWMKSTRAMEVRGGVVLQVTTQQRNIDGSYAVAEAVTFVPGVKVAEDVMGGRKLVRLG
jgi:hypothetical protein